MMLHLILDPGSEASWAAATPEGIDVPTVARGES
jgi:hypothetical protein